MQRALLSLAVSLALLVMLAPAASAKSGRITDARAGLQDSHGWVSDQQLQRYGTVRGLLVVFTYTFAAEQGQGQQPYDFHQVRYSINHGAERQIDSADARAFRCCMAQPGTHYVFKVQGCRRGTFGSDCTAWFERDLDTPPDATAPPPVPAPLPRTPPPTPLPTPRHIVLPHFATPTPNPYAINAPTVTVDTSTRLQCSRIANAAERAQCIKHVLAGKVHVTWTWRKSPCNAVTCYAADAFVAGAARMMLGPDARSAWVRPDDPDGCVAVSAMHNAPAMSASGSGCSPSRSIKGKPQ